MNSINAIEINILVSDSLRGHAIHPLRIVSVDIELEVFVIRESITDLSCKHLFHIGFVIGNDSPRSIDIAKERCTCEETAIGEYIVSLCELVAQTGLTTPRKEAFPRRYAGQVAGGLATAIVVVAVEFVVDRS